MVQANAKKYSIEKEGISKPKFMPWLKTLHFIGRDSESYNIWKGNAENYYEYYYFDNTDGHVPISTPLVWLEGILQDSYKTTISNLYQILVPLVAALFSATLWNSIIIASTHASTNTITTTNTTTSTTNTTTNNISSNSINEIIFGIIIGVIGIAILILYIRTKYRCDVNDAKMTVVLEHKCTEDSIENGIKKEGCKKYHFPS